MNEFSLNKQKEMEDFSTFKVAVTTTIDLIFFLNYISEKVRLGKTAGEYILVF